MVYDVETSSRMHYSRIAPRRASGTVKIYCFTFLKKIKIKLGLSVNIDLNVNVKDTKFMLPSCAEVKIIKAPMIMI